ncbi:23S rRNA (guanosine(2251)-2'-O)-methyltransferase RlmB [Ureaplasma sp. ES3154-GEN]|uniref:23S rRNA (guanosine(2251)-2'-O)-methyltransferase RlmB n=1 Tax=Ureaplasma sp. ES3154-GEN TaxID=2984844 RepID=UPI0021E72615|nr:23S rRNA (guanosine(2251)-2'-O)-methyltransferase RlmB [Ureaplasma sp. ES3154-GEN]MCV3743779.1 23S rRNA (guanosine(2251)-2'-O)-methyltransferase RlmB [Ureaplasma sp. ES3154-GEN]
MQYSFGKKALLDAINSHQKVKKVFCAFFDQTIIKLLQENKIPYEMVSKQWFNQFDKTLNHQHFAFESEQIFKEINLNTFIKKYNNSQSVILMLDEIQDPHNFGAILRSADAFGVNGVIYKKNNQTNINELVIKTSMGAINYLNLISVTNLNQSIKILQENGYWVYASALNAKAQIFDQIDYPQKTVIIMGNENKGVSPLVIKNADQQVYIPMSGHVQSLNVSVATGILLSYITRNVKK